MSGIQQLLLGGSPAGYQISRSLRFNSADSAFLNRTPASAGNRRTWTWSGWVKRGSLGVLNYFFSANTNAGSDTDHTDIRFSASDTLQFANDSGGSVNANLNTTQVFRDPSAWYHIVVAVNTTQATASNRIRMYVNGSEITAFGTATYPPQNTDLFINNNINHRIGAYQPTANFFNGYLTEINFIDGQQLTPSSFGQTNASTGVWEPIRYTGTYGTNGFYLPFSDNSTLVDVASDNATGSFSKRLTSGTNIGGMTSNGGLAAAFNGAFNNEASSAVASTTASGYVTTNSVGKDWGVGVTKTITAFQINSPTNDGFIGNQTAVGFKLQGSTDNFSSSVVDLYTGTTPSGTNQSVLVTSGITTTTAYRYHRIVINGNGTNLTRLGQVMFYEAGGFGVNQWQTNNFSVTAGVDNDSLVDTPTSYGSDTGVGGEVRGNYCTLNPLDVQDTAPTNGNLSYTRAAGVNGLCSGTFVLTSGKWYWEVTITTVRVASIVTGVGVSGRTAKAAGNAELGFYSDQYSYLNGGNKYNNATSTAYGASYTTGDIIGIAYDADAGTLVFYKNGVSQGTAFSSIPAGNIRPMAYSNGDAQSYNFGQRPFAYTAPSGFKALCTQNLPTPTIGATSTTQAGNFFNANLYTGTGSAFTLTGVGFQPDFGWFKGRNASSNHWLHDVVRGANPGLSSNNTLAEDTTAGQLTAFASDGYSLPNDTAGYLNFSGRTMVVWSWKGGGTGVTNTSGTITSTVSANTTSGFSVLTYNPNNTSGTIGHGLGVAPQFIIVRSRTNSGGDPWGVYHVSLGNTKYLRLNTTDAEATLSTVWNNTSPTSTVVSIGTSDIVSSADTSFIMYCFAPVAGYSAFGSYTGNGSTDGPFVYTGFRPRYVMFKRTNSTGNWIVEDTSRSPYNQMDAYISANASSAEATGAYYVDYLSNGFKLRYADPYGDTNASGSTYIFAAFAESPFKFSLAR